VRNRLVPVALVSGALLLGGCGTGLQATTYTKEKAPRDFGLASAGDLEIRNLAIAPPASGDGFAAGTDTASLTGSVVNTGTQDDALIGIEAEDFGSAQLQLNGQDTTSVPVPAGAATGSWTAVLTDPKKDLRAGTYTTVTLVFDRAGRVEGLRVPLRAGDTGLDSRTPAQDPYKVGE
jgi:copper(I)-binding protein